MQRLQQWQQAYGYVMCNLFLDQSLTYAGCDAAFNDKFGALFNQIIFNVCLF